MILTSNCVLVLHSRLVVVPGLNINMKPQMVRKCGKKHYMLASYDLMYKRKPEMQLSITVMLVATSDGTSYSHILLYHVLFSTLYMVINSH